MKILLINDYGSLAGGAEVIVFSLRDALRQRGHTVKVFTSSADQHSDSLIADEFCMGSTGRWRTMIQSANLSAAWRLRRLLKTFEPDVAHVSLYLTQLSPLILRELRTIPTLHYVQWNRPICPVGTRMLPSGNLCTYQPGLVCFRQGCVPIQDVVPLALQRRLDRYWGPASVNHVCAISHAVAQSLQTYGSPHLKSASVLHPGTPRVEARMEIAAEPRVIGAARLVESKGIHILIEAFSRIQSKHQTAQLEIIGDGPERASLQQLAAKLGVGDKVIFRGKQSHSSTLQSFRHAWCVCVPSLWEEPFGMVAAEAQMHGVPVIASRIGGLAEIIVDQKTGFSVPAGCSATIAACLDSLFNNPTQTLSMGLAAHQHAREQFSLEKFTEETEQLLHRLIQRLP